MIPLGINLKKISNTVFENFGEYRCTRRILAEGICYFRPTDYKKSLYSVKFDKFNNKTSILYTGVNRHEVEITIHSESICIEIFHLTYINLRTSVYLFVEENYTRLKGTDAFFQLSICEDMSSFSTEFFDELGQIADAVRTRSLGVMTS